MTDELPRPATRRVTHDDVAKASGVSRATVSYVLNDTAGRTISDATRALVLQNARRLGHIPYAPARTLRLGRSNIVLALVRDFAIGYVSNYVLKGLDLALAERGYVVLAHRWDRDLRPIAELWGLVSPALVVAMGGLSVSDGEVIEGSTKLLRVQGSVPHRMAGRMQAEYLIGTGRTRLGFAFPADPTLELIASERLAGVQDACRDAGLDEPAVRAIDSGDPATVFAALDAWGAEDLAVSAVAAHNDELALLVCEALRSRGLRPGADLGVIGIDNTPISRISLTTIEIDVAAWSAWVVESALAAIDDQPAPAFDDREFLRLIVRDSA